MSRITSLASTSRRISPRAFARSTMGASARCLVFLVGALFLDVVIETWIRQAGNMGLAVRTCLAWADTVRA